MSLVCCGVELMDCFDLCLLLLVFMLVFFCDNVRTYNRGVIQASATLNVRLEADIQICAAFNVPRLALHSTSVLLSLSQLVVVHSGECYKCRCYFNVLGWHGQ